MKRLMPALLASLALVGCATSVKKAAVPVPTYSEKAHAAAVEASAGVCAEVPRANNDDRALVPMANACVKAHQWDRVEAYGQALATRWAQAPWGAYYLSLAASARQDYARAQWMIELALKKSPEQALFHYELARVYSNLKDDAGVIKEMKSAAKLDSELTPAHLFVGQLALRQNDYAEARRELTLAVKSEPSHPVALLALAEAQLKSKDFLASEDVLTRAIKVNPRNGDARLALAQLQETHLKKFDEALATLKELRQLSADRKLDGTTPNGLNERIQSLEKTVSQAKRDEDKSTRMPSAERK